MSITKISFLYFFQSSPGQRLSFTHTRIRHNHNHRILTISHASSVSSNENFSYPISRVDSSRLLYFMMMICALTDQRASLCDGASTKIAISRFPVIPRRHRDSAPHLLHNYTKLNVTPSNISWCGMMFALRVERHTQNAFHVIRRWSSCNKIVVVEYWCDKWWLSRGPTR